MLYRRLGRCTRRIGGMFGYGPFVIRTAHAGLRDLEAFGQGGAGNEWWSRYAFDGDTYRVVAQRECGDARADYESLDFDHRWDCNDWHPPTNEDDERTSR